MYMYVYVHVCVCTYTCMCMSLYSKISHSVLLCHTFLTLACRLCVFFKIPCSVSDVTLFLEFLILNSDFQRSKMFLNQF